MSVARNIIIISAGKFGREVYSWVVQTIEAGAPWRIKGFLDDRSGALNGFKYEVGVISSVEGYRPENDDLFVSAIGDPTVRRRYCEQVLHAGGKFATLIHPTAVVGQNVTVGMGVIIAPFVMIGADVSLGNFACVGPYSVCSHDNRIGDWCHMSGHCCFGGNVTIEDMCFVGMRAVVVPGVCIRKQAFVGVGSVVLKNVRSGAKVFGNPAVQIDTVEVK